ncbi:MAG: glycosyltransferase family 4 protein [Chloroflexi bacterium]|nr:glycosyltransferase family 4 protein [Chloroflexota bacterium]
MHIVVIQETDWLKRGPHQQHHLFERLSQRGHSITVLDYPILREHWPREALFAKTQIVDNAARIYEGAQIRLMTPGTLSVGPVARISSLTSHRSQLQQIIAQQPPDIIVSYALSTGIPAARLAQRHGIPLLFHLIDALHTLVPAQTLQSVARLVERRLLRNADQVLLINEHLKDYALNMGADPQKTQVLRTGVDLTRFQPDRDGSAKRAELGIGPDDLVLFFMGWLYEFCGLNLVADALEDAPEHVKLLVVGDGDLYGALQRRADSDLRGRLIMTGRVPYAEIPELTAVADVHLLPFELVPATQHIVPIKLYEYMASGKPVIATPLPGVKRDVGGGNGVLYVPPSQQVTAALAARGSYRELGQQARRFVEAYCDWNTITDQFEQLLQSMI